MKRALVVVLALVAAVLPASFLLAAGPPTGTPSITITSPQNGTVIHGSTVTVHVAVANFELVQPVLKNPKPLKGNIGHIHYVLDAAFNPARDSSMSLTHTWHNVRPGSHTIVAYLANNLNLPFPTTRQATVSITVAGAGPPPTPRAPATATPSATASIGSAPTTGGGGGKTGLQFNTNLFLLGLLLIILGLLFFGRLFSHRFALANAVIGSQPAATTVTPPATQAAFEGEAQSGPPPSPMDPPVLEPVADVSPLPQQTAPPQTPPEPAASPISAMQPPNSWQAPPPGPIPLPSLAPERSETAWTPGPQPTAGLMAPPPVSVAPAADTRTRALEMAQQWSSLVQDLVRQLEAQEADRRQLQDRITALELMTQRQQALRQALTDGSTPISSDDVQAVQFVADELLKDPDHIVVLASVAQNADRLARIVNQYARIHRALGE